MRKKVIIMVALFLFAPIMVFASQSFSWLPNSENNLAGYRIYVRAIFEEYDRSSPDWDGVGELRDGRVHATLDKPLNGIYYFVCVAYNTSGLESNFSRELRLYYINDSLTKKEVNKQSDDDGIHFSLPDTASIGVTGYEIWYQKDGGELETVDIGSLTEYTLDLSDGTYEIQVVPYNDVGDDFDDYSSSFVYIWPALEKPQLKIEAVGIGLNTLVLTAVKPPNDPRVDYWYYFIASSYEKMINRDYDICDGGVTGDGNIIENISSLRDDYDMIFLKVVPVNDASAAEGDAEIAYQLFGNIVGTYNEGVSWDDADVYYVDYNAFGYYYGKNVVRPDINDYVNKDLWNELPFSYAERADFSGDARVYYEDYNFFGQNYGHFGEDY